jgi:hypothetical protein
LNGADSEDTPGKVPFEKEVNIMREQIMQESG